MGITLFSVEGAFVSSVFIVVLYVAYRAVLPKPLPGIPYNRDAANGLLGDIPEMMRYVLRTKRIFCWLTSLTARHQSPIVQVFIKPMTLPWVVVTDPFESQDILLRRTKEFDRSGFFGEIIGGILPEQHIQFLSTDARFKDSRILINHLMAPTFISQVSAPDVYKSVCTLIKVWQAKCDLAKGRPFSAQHDITYAALDSIFASSFGLPEPESITINRLEAVKQWDPEIPEDIDQPVPFPESRIPEIFAAVLTLTNSLTDTQLSPAPVFTSWVIGKLPYMRKATVIKNQYIRNKVNESVRLIESGDTNPRSALHSVLLREKAVAEKDGRKPDYYKNVIVDEFFGLVAAGHDTTASAVAWGVKLLSGSDNARVQDILRTALRTELAQAARERRAPTYQELAGAHVPYLDAVVEEVLRHANTVSFVARRAQEDTTVLGCRIPRGTDVFMVANGAGYLTPNMRIDDAMRSPGARSGCFGKRLALQALRIEFALILWHFKLREVPDALAGYEGVQKFAREPARCYVRLENAGF